MRLKTVDLLLLILILSATRLSQIVNAKKKERSNIVLSGGGGCKSGACENGSGALVMESGKGKKNEKLIIKDDTLVMQDGEADGNIIMDGNNLIFKEGKKNENIIIKGNGGQCCHQNDVYHQEDHVSHPIGLHLDAEQTSKHMTFVPVSVQHKQEVHHHSKKVHHNDRLGLDSRREDEANHNASVSTSGEPSHTNEPREQKGSTKRKTKKKRKKIRKLKLGDKLSSKEKEHLKLQRVDRRLGRFRLAEKMMGKIRWRKNAKVTNSKEKSQEIDKDEQQPSKEESQDNDEQQYEDGDESNKDQEEETSGSNMYDGFTNVMYPPMSTGYMTSSDLSNVMNLYLPSSLVLPASNRRDLRKKYEQRRKIKNLDHVEEQIKEAQIKTESQKSLESDGDEEMDSEEKNDQEHSKSLKEDASKADQTLKASESVESSSKSINQIAGRTATQGTNSLAGNNIIQPIFAPDERQVAKNLTPSLYSLLAMTSSIQQRLALPTHQLPTATLPLFTPTKSPLESSAALLLPLIAHRSHRQQQLIRAQQQKLLVQEVKQKALTRQLQQANVRRNEQNVRNLFREEYTTNNHSTDRPELEEKKNEKAMSSKLLYADELKHWDELPEEAKKSSNSYDDEYTDIFDQNDNVSINRSRRRKSEQNKNIFENSRILIKDGKQGRHFSRQARIKESDDDEFDFSGVDNLKAVNANKLRTRKQRKQIFAKRMYTNESATETNNVAKSNNAGHYKASTFSEVRLARNASLIGYGY